MKLIIVVALALVALAQVDAFSLRHQVKAQRIDEALNEQWDQFKRKHEKVYKNAEEEMRRRAIWEENFKFIGRHNQEADKGLHTYRVSMNPYGDLTNEEFVKQRNGFNMTAALLSRKADRPVFTKPVGVKIPDSVDWRTQGYVAPIKNQGQCGSCWAFTAIDSLEGQHKKATGNLVELSEQNLVDCSQSFGNMGCNGGLPDQAFQYIIANGIDTLASYPYTGVDGDCKFSTANIGATEKSFVDVNSGDEDAYTAAIALIGPIASAMDASHSSFQFYSSGIYSDPQCSSTQLDHGITAVGYGADEKGNQYYIMRNMWGTDWGDKGYVLIARNKHNMCGLATLPSYPVV